MNSHINIQGKANIHRSFEHAGFFFLLLLLLFEWQFVCSEPLLLLPRKTEDALLCPQPMHINLLPFVLNPVIWALTCTSFFFSLSAPTVLLYSMELKNERVGKEFPLLHSSLISSHLNSVCLLFPFRDSGEGSFNSWETARVSSCRAPGTGSSFCFFFRSFFKEFLQCLPDMWNTHRAHAWSAKATDRMIELQTTLSQNIPNFSANWMLLNLWKPNYCLSPTMIEVLKLWLELENAVWATWIMR